MSEDQKATAPEDALARIAQETAVVMGVQRHRLIRARSLFAQMVRQDAIHHREENERWLRGVKGST